ncbi:MAG: phosphonate C-P lyase system protein PhnG [Chloroflexota bacterium]|nr:phosphonate C-P lyase system protein PhnG [Chloroflexota bacterium]
MMTPSVLSRADLLSILTHAPADPVKSFAETLLDQVGAVTVLRNRTALVMLPFTDTASGTRFHLGEVLVAEAHLQINLYDTPHEGYAAVTGRDLVQAVGIALIDAAYSAGIAVEAITVFAAAQAAEQAASDDVLLRQVEATRIEMETF